MFQGENHSFYMELLALQEQISFPSEMPCPVSGVEAWGAQSAMSYKGLMHDGTKSSLAKDSSQM